jgi:hypothetical protein
MHDVVPAAPAPLFRASLRVQPRCAMSARNRLRDRECGGVERLHDELHMHPERVLRLPIRLPGCIDADRVHSGSLLLPQHRVWGRPDRRLLDFLRL